MNLRCLMWILPALSLLAGCQQVGQSAVDAAGVTSQIMVIHPGFEMAIGGKSVPVVGSDACPAAGPPFIYLSAFPEPYAGRSGCVVLDGRKHALVSFNGTQETWNVIHEADSRGWPRIRLQRANGEFVAAAENGNYIACSPKGCVKP